ncbi:mycothiol synthase [Corynebacterium hylobatis]|uniref:Mycothiol acetyltransferase n=1 Tax=Corynebacterium hylobatis TaxID=1859290 RepID=A0A3S0BG44_9CORY|nr:mycothiol synthase [Corynebacterium hylobatis]RSZ61564.1 mycothiol synthase [Corynebacterium hylobatis]
MKIEPLDLPTHPELADAARDLLADAARADGVEAFSEQFVLGLSDARLWHRHLLARDGDQLLGLAACDDASCELVVAPSARRRGVARALLTELRGRDVWAHGNLPAARALAEKEGRKMARRLLVMAVEGEALREAASFEPREDVEALNLVESVARYGRDLVEEQWLAANNEAFSWHPEQGGWDRDRLSRAQEADWFAEEDVLFLWSVEEPVLAGFHWTKWHTEESPAFGEVYVVGLASDFRGRRLGDPLLRLGLAHMAGKGAERVILYVEADNGPAVRVYEKLGFHIAEEHAVWSPA